MKTAIVGAGAAGLACAMRLRAAGEDVVLFDKSRGVGGRMATRRVDGLSFDHGAQFFTARGDAFRETVSGLVAAGACASWGSDERYVGVPGMTAVPRALAEGFEIRTEHTVSGLRRDAAGWTLSTAEGAEAGGFDRVVLALPSPQIVPLLAASGFTLPGIESAVYAPCIALLLAFERPLPGIATEAKYDAGPIAWIARNATKPGRDGARETVVVHASADWSRAHLDFEPDASKPILLAAFRDATGFADAPTYAAVHRWRYALVETPAGARAFFDSELGLGACGDWCIGGRVEAAFDSGLALADMITEMGAAA